MGSSSYEDYFVTAGILTSSHTSRAAKALLKVQPSLNLAPYESPSSYVKSIWRAVLADGLPSTLNGTVFELILSCVLLKENLIPFYMEAEVQYVPNAHFDLLLYSKEIGPIVLSAKTSLRERYKQADLESQALRDVHRRSKTFLITLSAKEAMGVKKKIQMGEVTNLDDVVVADTKSFDSLVRDLHSYTFIAAPTLPVIHKGKLITR